MTTYPQASLLRRLGALLYDLMAIIALLMLVGALWLPFNGGEAITAEHPLYPLLRVTLILTPFIFYLFFWLRDGQTLGMRAWRLRIQQWDGRPIRPEQAIIRLFAAILSWLPFGLGFFWMNFTPTFRTWHDTISKTEIVQLPKKEH